METFSYFVRWFYFLKKGEKKQKSNNKKQKNMALFKNRVLLSQGYRATMRSQLSLAIDQKMLKQ